MIEYFKRKIAQWEHYLDGENYDHFVKPKRAKQYYRNIVEEDEYPNIPHSPINSEYNTHECHKILLEEGIRCNKKK